MCLLVICARALECTERLVDACFVFPCESGESKNAFFSHLIPRTCSDEHIASLRQLCTDLVVQRAAADAWAPCVAEENRTLRQITGQVLLRDPAKVRCG